MLRRLWTDLTTIPTAPPPDRPRWHGRAWSALAAAISVLYAVTYTQAYLAGNTNSHLLAAVLYNARSMLIVAIAIWTAIGVPWRATSAVEQRTGHIMACIYVLLIALICVVVWLDPPRKSPAVVVYTYYMTISIFLGQGLVVVRRGHVIAGGVILVLSLLVEILGSLGIANPQRMIAIPLLYVLVILIAGLLVRWWSAPVFAIILPLLQTALQIAGLAVGESNWTFALTQMLFLGAIGGLVAFYARSLEAALSAETAKADAAIAAFEAHLASLRASHAFVSPEATAAPPHTRSTSGTPPGQSGDSA